MIDLHLVHYRSGPVLTNDIREKLSDLSYSDTAVPALAIESDFAPCLLAVIHRRIHLARIICVRDDELTRLRARDARVPIARKPVSAVGERRSGNAELSG
jgi:hypothetical protein